VGFAYESVNVFPHANRRGVVSILAPVAVAGDIQ